MQLRAPRPRSRPFSLERREPRAHDVLIDILYCGVCHSDIHQARDEWGGSHLPDGAGPRDRRARDAGRQRGHEVQGRRRASASAASSTPAASARPATRARSSTASRACVGTYNGTRAGPATPTYGGYSTQHRRSTRTTCCASPDSIPLDRAAPLLCAGITTYSPLRALGREAGRHASASSASAASATWREARRGDGRRGHGAQHLAAPSATTR